MFYCFAKSKAYIHYYIFNSCLFANSNPLYEIIQHVIGNILINRIVLHRLRRSLNVHTDIRHAQSGNCWYHFLIKHPSADVIHNRCPRFYSSLCNRRIVGINRNKRFWKSF